MKISEIFYSIQGEGSLVGVPSVFVRTSGCNLRCTWCDTPYTSWQPEGQEMANEAIVHTVMDFGARHVVLTGGEPMIAPKTVELTQAFRSRGLHITIETAGTVFAPVACDLLSVSPKLSNSTPLEREGGRWAAQHDRLRIQIDVLRRLTTEFLFQFKFVVTAQQDLAEIQELCSQCSVSPSHVILMPEGTRGQVLHERALWLVEVCKQTGFRYSPRLHVDLWGDRRGM